MFQIKDASFYNPLNVKCILRRDGSRCNLRNYVPHGVAENNESSNEAVMWHNPHAIHRERAKIVVIARCSRLLRSIAVCLKRANDREYRGLERVVAERNGNCNAWEDAHSRECIHVLFSAKRTSPACTRKKYSCLYISFRCLSLSLSRSLRAEIFFRVYTRLKKK